MRAKAALDTKTRTAGATRRGGAEGDAEAEHVEAENVAGQHPPGPSSSTSASSTSALYMDCITDEKEQQRQIGTL